MRTRKHSSPMETVWVDKHVYDEAERLHYERATEQLVAEQFQESELVGGCVPEVLSENILQDDQKHPKNSRKQKRQRRSLKNKGSFPKLGVLSGPFLEHVWFDKYLYEEAESVYQAKLAADVAKELGDPKQSVQTSAAVPSLAVDRWEMNKLTGQAAITCSHSSLVACHHIVCGFWLNKASFDTAEILFVERFGTLLAPRPLDLPLSMAVSGPDLPLHRTPDEGYVTAMATPATPGQTIPRVIDPQLYAGNTLDETVNGKPQWPGLQELIYDVWLEKPLYDDAERSFYENLSGSSLPLGKVEELCNTRKPETVNKTKKSARRLNASKSSKKSHGEVRSSERSSLPFNYFVHPDSERVWPNKSEYDEAESQYHMARANDLSSCCINDRHLTPWHPGRSTGTPPTVLSFNPK
ncbi:uncharacterized protein LOC144828460 [Lissotriton helveticus]